MNADQIEAWFRAHPALTVVFLVVFALLTWGGFSSKKDD